MGACGPAQRGQTWCSAMDSVCWYSESCSVSVFISSAIWRSPNCITMEWYPLMSPHRRTRSHMESTPAQAEAVAEPG